MLDGLHHVDLNRRFVAANLVALPGIQAMLGRNRPLKADHAVMHDAIDFVLQFDERGIGNMRRRRSGAL